MASVSTCQGLLLPRDRNKTLTGLAGAEPITGAQHREVQRLQWFLSESAWDHEQVVTTGGCGCCARTRPPPRTMRGVLVIDDTGDRKDGTATAHVARQYLGSVGKIDNGIVAVTSLWADERCYWPVHAVPYTPAARGLPAASAIPGSRPSRSSPSSWSTPPSQAWHSIPGGGGRLLRTATIPASPKRLAPPRSRSCWPSSPARAPGHPPTKPTPRAEAASELGWRGSTTPGGGGGSPAASVTATPRPGGRPTPSSAAGARIGALRLVVASTDPGRLPGHSTWYLLTNLPRPAQPPRPAGRPGRHRAPVRAAQLGRAGLQAGQRRARLGRLPGPL